MRATYLVLALQCAGLTGFNLADGRLYLAAANALMTLVAVIGLVYARPSIRTERQP